MPSSENPNPAPIVETEVRLELAAVAALLREAHRVAADRLKALDERIRPHVTARHYSVAMERLVPWTFTSYALLRADSAQDELADMQRLVEKLEHAASATDADLYAVFEQEKVEAYLRENPMETEQFAEGAHA